MCPRLMISDLKEMLKLVVDLFWLVGGAALFLSLWVVLFSSLLLCGATFRLPPSKWCFLFSLGGVVWCCLSPLFWCFLKWCCFLASPVWAVVLSSFPYVVVSFPLGGAAFSHMTTFVFDVSRVKITFEEPISENDECSATQEEDLGPSTRWKGTSPTRR